MKAKLIMWGLVLFLLGYFLSLYLLLENGSAPSVSTVDFLLKFGFVVAAFVTIFLALFGDYLRELIFPIHVRIEIPEKGNVGLDESMVNDKQVAVYCHHLMVRNLTPHRVIKDCRVWLTKVFVQNAEGKWEPKNQSPVPRLMEWAPSEYSANQRTFSTWQVFDFGMTIENNGGFVLRADREQGGNFHRIFPIGSKVLFKFIVTADNYQKEKTFSFEVTVPGTVQGETVTPSTVRLVK
jgi:hypothetical protein